MFRLATTITVFLNLTVVAYGQEVMFDHPHDDDGALFLKEINGEQVVVDRDGTPLELHDVFRLSAQERVEQGLSVAVEKRIADGGRNQDVVFNLTYLDQVNGTGKGFDDPVLGEARRNTLEAAFAYYASLIQDIGSADVEIRESFSGHPMSNPFAIAAAYYYGSKGFNQSFTTVHLTTGNDPHGSFPDGYMQFNFHSNLDYSYSVNGFPGPQQYDFYTIALHEILHLLGFTSYATGSGASAASPDVFTSFDEFLSDYAKDPVFELSGSGSGAAVSQPNDGVLTSNQVWFELYPGQHAPVFSPDPFNGSSLDHFDNGRTDHGAYLMHPSLTNGDAFKLLHEDEVRVLEQLGYSVSYSIATSVDEFSIEEAPAKVISDLYPNPAYSTDGVQIDLGQVNGNEVLVIVYDMMGRESYSKVILNRGPGPITAIDPYHNLKPGMYIVIGSSEDELFNQKLVIR